MPVYVFTAQKDWQNTTLLSESSLVIAAVTAIILNIDSRRTRAPAVIRIRIVRGIRVEIRNAVVATVDAL